MNCIFRRCRSLGKTFFVFLLPGPFFDCLVHQSLLDRTTEEMNRLRLSLALILVLVSALSLSQFAESAVIRGATSGLDASLSGGSQQASQGSSQRVPRTHARLPLTTEATIAQSIHGGVTVTHSKRGSLATIVIGITDDATNASFSQAVCNTLAADVISSTLEILNGPALPLALPACVSGSSNLRIIRASVVVIENWSHFPSALESLQCIECLYGQGNAPSSNNDGWDDNGMFAWNEIFASLPNLQQLELLLSRVPASLPSSLPASLNYLDLTACGITGTIPSTFFPASNPERWNILLSDNQITGALPATLLNPLQGNDNLIEFTLALSDNQLSGSLPSGLFNPLVGKNLDRFSVQLQNNLELSGSLPSNLFPASTWASSSFSLLMDNTNISGPIPEEFFAGIPPIDELAFSASHTQITGPLPDYLFGPNWKPNRSLHIDLSNSKLTGTIPPGFISGHMTSNQSVAYMYVNLRDNDLEGTIPQNLLWNELDVVKKDSHSLASETASNMESQVLDRVGLQATEQFQLHLTGNRLSGSIPDDLFALTLALSPSQVTTVVDLGYNLLNGSIPNRFLDTFAPASASAEIMLNDNQLSGSLPQCSSGRRYSLFLQNNAFSGPIPAAWDQCGYLRINLERNVGINGSLPAGLFDETELQDFNAAHTSIVGDIPTITFGSSLRSLVLSNTRLNFCSASSLDAVALLVLPQRSCEVTVTNACNCVETYTRCFPELPDHCDTDPVVPVVPVDPVDPVDPEPVPEDSTIPSTPTAHAEPQEAPTQIEPQQTPITPNTPPTSSSVPSLLPIDVPISSSPSGIACLALIVCSMVLCAILL